jgi:hypothetical protein
MRTVGDIAQGHFDPTASQSCGDSRVGDEGADLAIMTTQLIDDCLAEGGVGSDDDDGHRASLRRSRFAGGKAPFNTEKEGTHSAETVF